MTPSFLKSLEALAEAIAKRAAEPDTSLPESTDALKALTPYLVALSKHREPEGINPGGPSFDQFAADLHGSDEGPADGAAPIRSRQRRNGSSRAATTVPTI